MYKAVQKVLFASDAEKIHNVSLAIFSYLGRFTKITERVYGNKFNRENKRNKQIRVFGLNFPNRVGLAAGFDKDGIAWRGLSLMGFGHIEIGTVTLRPQIGNPKPRIFRYPAYSMLINRMGFPSRGSDYVISKIDGWKPKDLILGVNIGKNKETPNEEATYEYIKLFKKFALLADYIAINVSSPNTIGLRKLQARKALEKLCKYLIGARHNYKNIYGKYVPLLLKISPDLRNSELEDIIDVVCQTGIDGIIATNTTVSRFSDGTNNWETGGLSGRPLYKKSLEVIKFINQTTGGKVKTVGVGGIFSLDDAKKMIDAGAALIQIYTGFIYNGPTLIKKLASEL